MPNKKISALNPNTSPTLNDVFPIVNNGETKKLNLGTLSSFLQTTLSIENSVITGGTYSAGTITFTNSTGGTFTVTGITETPKHWISDENIIIDSDETTVISGNYVLENCTLTINDSNISITANTLNSSVLTFNKYGQLFIGGYLLLINTNIVNNGLISIAGGPILVGASAITGTGILI